MTTTSAAANNKIVLRWRDVHRAETIRTISDDRLSSVRPSPLPSPYAASPGCSPIDPSRSRYTFSHGLARAAVKGIRELLRGCFKRAPGSPGAADFVI